ncbi:MAG: hypothetical protein KGL39_47610 [Patescibacteria group bacterium]|nr:hypothetical protein [Patescibacteria group bacterium]
MQGVPHKHHYTYYAGCNHKVKECHKRVPNRDRVPAPIVHGPCPTCKAKAEAKLRASLGVCVG